MLATRDSGRRDSKSVRDCSYQQVANEFWGPLHHSKPVVRQSLTRDAAAGQAKRRPEKNAETVEGAPAQVGKKTAVVLKIHPERYRDREHIRPVREGLENAVPQQLSELSVQESDTNYPSEPCGAGQ
jgi:hypothetical protein